jgi:hypothetical protein
MIRRGSYLLGVVCAAALLGLPSHSALAESKSKSAAVKGAESPLSATASLQAFDEQVVELRKLMDDGRFDVISASDKASVERDLAQIRALLAEKGSVDAMNDREKIALFNAQERVNATMLRNDGDRLVCEHVRSTGSKFKTKVCKTVAQIKREQEAGRRQMEDFVSRGMPAKPPEPVTLPPRGLN